MGDIEPSDIDGEIEELKMALEEIEDQAKRMWEDLDRVEVHNRELTNEFKSMREEITLLRNENDELDERLEVLKAEYPEWERAWTLHRLKKEKEVTSE